MVKLSKPHNVKHKTNFTFVKVTLQVYKKFEKTQIVNVALKVNPWANWIFGSLKGLGKGGGGGGGGCLV